MLGAMADPSPLPPGPPGPGDSDSKFRKLSQAEPDLIYQFQRLPDGTYCVPMASEGINNIFGCTSEAVRRTFLPIERAILPEDLPMVIATIEASARKLLPYSCRFRVRHSGRPIQYLEAKSVPEKLADGSIVWHGYCTDITGPEQTEEFLRRVTTAVEHSPVSVLITNIRGTIEYVNPYFTQVSGYSMEDLHGKTPRVLKSGDRSPDEYRAIWDTILSGEIWQGEFRNRRKDGTLFWSRPPSRPSGMSTAPSRASWRSRKTSPKRRRRRRRGRSWSDGCCTTTVSKVSASWPAGSPTISTTSSP